YYQRHDVEMIRSIRGLLYEQGFTIGGARQQLAGDGPKHEERPKAELIRQLRGELEEVLAILR
ncbi:MAG: MerR family transcriptional regulator, partial [Anaerolineae bacterium]|nr:MerR family transcriptional regulator [Anaerolineae bacterium]